MLVGELETDALQRPVVDTSGDAVLLPAHEVQALNRSATECQLLNLLVDPYPLVTEDRNDLRIFKALPEKRLLQEARPPVIFEIGPKAVAAARQSVEPDFDFAFQWRCLGAAGFDA